MPQLSADRYVAEIEASTAGLAEILGEYDLSLPIPTCPEWTLRQLVTHVGRAHRWAAEITRTRSDAFIPFREVPDGKLPDGRAEQCAWLRAGAARIVDAVGEAGSDHVWSFTGLVPHGHAPGVSPRLVTTQRGGQIIQLTDRRISCSPMLVPVRSSIRGAETVSARVPCH